MSDTATTPAAPEPGQEPVTPAPPPEPPAPAAPPAATPRSLQAQRPHVEGKPTGRRLALLSLTALGVVYGDIGTSPLYAFRECFKPTFGLSVNAGNVHGILSLIIWSLLFVVSVKYIVFIMKADNRGEGGILALLALLLQRTHRTADSKTRGVLIAFGLFGAALLYGDGIITPAVSVLSAVEGMQIATPALAHWVLPLSVIVIFGLFMCQRLGTARVGVAFGPVTLVWFVAIGILGLREIVHNPGILAALNPWYAIDFFFQHNLRAFFVLGAVVLAVTGAEALYADMGHFGKRPIRLAWFAMALPCLLLNYLGQGALVLRLGESAAANPFYLLVPKPLLIPMVVLATMAAIIASQALISGAFSLTQQSVQLGYSPRVQIIHTSRKEVGQVYIPEVNWALMAGCLLLVLAFRSSGALASAYGVAVTGTMLITSVLYAVVARSRWGWSRLAVGSLAALFLIVDIAFLVADTIKIEFGGWVPLVIAGLVYALMSTWKLGRAQLGELLQRGSLPLSLFLEDVERRKPPRVPGTAVFMTSSDDGAPVVLLHHVKHNKVLHQQVVLMSVQAEEVPEIPGDERVTLEELGQGFFRVRARYGFMESPDVEEILICAAEAGLRARPQETSFYLGRERLIPRKKGGMMQWRKKLFVLMSRNARSATEFFNIPPNRVVELGTQLEF